MTGKLPVQTGMYGKRSVLFPDNAGGLDPKEITIASALKKYGGKRYFSEETLEKILPKDLKQFYPNLTYYKDWDRDRSVGIGTVIQEWKVKDKQTGEDRYMLSKNVIGHGSATSSQFRIDLDNNIIITQTRRRGKSRFGPNFEKLYKHIDN